MKIYLNVYGRGRKSFVSKTAMLAQRIEVGGMKKEKSCVWV